MYWTVFLVLCQSLLWNTMAFLNGAPSSACLSMTPNHYNTVPQIEKPPFSVNVSATSYKPGDKIQVTIGETSPASSKRFKGFLIQARRVEVNADTFTPLGTFTPVAKTKSVICGSPDSVLTHNSAFPKKVLTFNWTAPAEPKGDVAFRVTFVENYVTYWVNVYSPVITDTSATTK